MVAREPLRVSGIAEVRRDSHGAISFFERYDRARTLFPGTTGSRINERGEILFFPAACTRTENYTGS